MKRLYACITATLFAVNTTAHAAEIPDIPKVPDLHIDLNPGPNIHNLPGPLIKDPVQHFESPEPVIIDPGPPPPPPPPRHYVAPVPAPNYDDWRRQAREVLSRWNEDQTAKEFREFAEKTKERSEAFSDDFACFIVMDRWGTKLPQKIMDDFAKEVLQKIEAKAIEDVYHEVEDQFAKLEKSTYSWFDSSATKESKRKALEELSIEVRDIHDRARYDATKHLNVVATRDKSPAQARVVLSKSPVSYSEHAYSKLAIRTGTAFRQLQQSAREGSMASVLKEKKDKQ